MEETAQNFEKRFFINRSQICIALPKFYVTHRIYEILSKSLVPNVDPMTHLYSKRLGRRVSFSTQSRIYAQLNTSISLVQKEQKSLSIRLVYLRIFTYLNKVVNKQWNILFCLVLTTRHLFVCIPFPPNFATFEEKYCLL